MSRSPRAALGVVAALSTVVALLPLVRAAQTPPAPTNAYTVIGLDSRHVLPIRQAGTAEEVPLDQVASLFGVTTSEDRLTNSVTIQAKGQRIVLTNGQPFASLGGRVVSLSGPATRDRTGWFVPVDLLSRVLGPALNIHIDVRRPSHLIAVGTAALTSVTTHIDRVPTGGRVTIDTDAAVGHHVTQTGNRLVVQFDAQAIDASATTGSAPDFIADTHVEGNTLVVDLGPSAGTVHTGTDASHIVIDVAAAASPTPPPAAVAAPAGAAPRTAPVQTVAPDLNPTTGVRTVVLDPGHGGDDAGVHGPGTIVEKDVVLQLAKRAKAAIESRLGIRVLLTREGDESVTGDKRTAFANNAKADLFISLHANASYRSSAHGAEVFALDLGPYQSRAADLGAGDRVPVVGGGVRVIQAVPWELAQLPFASRSASLAATTLRHLSAQNVPLFARASDTAPLVELAGINMPAILVETAFLSNADDARALSGDLGNAIVEAIVDTIAEVRASGPTRPAPGPDRP